MELKFAKTRKGKLVFAFFIVMTVFAVMLPITAFSLAESDLERLTDPDVMRMVHKVGYFESLGRKILWQILIWLAQLVDYFEKAVDQITNYNLYNLIKNQFDINAVAYPIAWAAASVAVIFVAVLLIYNADKTRLTDFARGIVTSIILILALPAMVSALSELRSTGVEYVKSTTGQESGSDSEGVYFKETLGQKTLSPYVYYTVDSVKNNARTSIRGNKTSTWGEKTTYASGYTPTQMYKMDINEKLPYDTLQYYITDVEEYPVGVQTKYSELTYEKRRELVGIDPYYREWQEIRSNNPPYSQRSKEYINSHYGPASTYGPCNSSIPWTGCTWHFWSTIPGTQETYNDRWYWIYTKEAPDFQSSYEYRIVEWAIDETINKLNNLDVDLDMTVISQVESRMRRAGSLADALESLDKIRVRLDGRDYMIMELLNIENNEKLSHKDIEYVGTGHIEELLDDTEYYNKAEWEKIALNIISFGDPLEHVYKYDFDFLWAFISLFILLIALFFAGLKLAGLLYDILFAQIVVPIIVASDMNSSGKAKAAVQNLINTFLIFIIVNLLLRLYILILGSIHTATDLNFLAKIILILAGAKFVIDGPDIVTKILGIDAGVKSGLATLMGVRTAVQMGTSAVRTAKSVGGKAAHAGGSVANRTGGAVGGALSGFVGGAVGGGSATEGAKGLKGAMRGGLNTVGGAVGGAFAGGAKGAMNGTNKDTLAKGFNSGKSAGETLASPISSLGGKKGSEELSSGTSDSGGNSGSSGGSSGGETSGSNNESGVSNSTSHVSSDSSAPAVGGAFLGGGGSAVPVKGEKGDKGDKGDKGNDGLQGMQGNRGETGEKGKDAENNTQSSSVNNGSAFSGTWADQQRSAESNSSSWAQQTRSAESSSPTFAEQQHRAEQPTYHAPAPSAPSAPAQPSEPKNYDKK